MAAVGEPARDRDVAATGVAAAGTAPGSLSVSASTVNGRARIDTM
ncbi:MAG: hypothetical protein ACREET_11875 [Stellaceae bacterium]